MAKKRKKSGGRRRRRIGAIAMNANSPLVKYGSLGAGYLMATQIRSLIDKVVQPPTDPTKAEQQSKIINGVLAAGGLYFLLMYKGRKTTLTTILAGIAGGAGAKGLLKDYGVVSGFRSIPVVSGYSKIPTIGNYRVPGAAPQLNGIGNDLGYSVPSGLMGSIGRVTDDQSFGGPGINPDAR